MKTLLLKNEGNIVVGWSGNMEIIPEGEFWYHGFTKKYSLLELDHCEILDYQQNIDLADENGMIECQKRAKTRILPHLYLANGLLKAVIDDCSVDKWLILHGADDAPSEVYRYAKKIEYYLKALCRIENKTKLSSGGDELFIQAFNELKVLRFNKNYVFGLPDDDTSRSILPFIALEIFEVCRLNLSVCKCISCGDFFTKRKRQRKPVCSKCPPPSQTLVSDLSYEEAENRRMKTLKRVQDYRERKKKEAQDRNLKRIQEIMSY